MLIIVELQVLAFFVAWFLHRFCKSCFIHHIWPISATIGVFFAIDFSLMSKKYFAQIYLFTLEDNFHLFIYVNINILANFDVNWHFINIFTALTSNLCEINTPTCTPTYSINRSAIFCNEIFKYLKNVVGFNAAKLTASACGNDTL